MRHSSILFVGLDGHKESIAVAYAPEERDAEVVFLGTISTHQCDIDTLVRQLTSKASSSSSSMKPGSVGTGAPATSRRNTCFAGSWPLSWSQRKQGTASKPIDATQVARVMRSGDLTPVDVPSVEDEAIHDLSRAREDALRDLQAAKNRLQAFLLRQDRRNSVI